MRYMGVTLVFFSREPRLYKRVCPSFGLLVGHLYRVEDDFGVPNDELY